MKIQLAFAAVAAALANASPSFAEGPAHAASQPSASQANGAASPAATQTGKPDTANSGAEHAGGKPPTPQAAPAGTQPDKPA